MNLIISFFQNASIKAKILTFGGIFLFLTIIIISIINLIGTSNQSEPINIDIVNYSESFENTKLPDYYQDQIQQYIWTEIGNTANAENYENPENIPATIRPGSIKKTDEDQYFLIVDIEPLRYSFRVSFFYNPELANQPYVEPGYYIECPHPDEVIYPDTPCPLGTPIEQVKRYLPISLTGDGFTEDVHALTSSTGDYIMVKVNTCNDNDLPIGNMLFRNWLKELYIDPNDILYGITKICPSN